VGYNLSDKLGPFIRYYTAGLCQTGHIGRLVVSDQFWLMYATHAVFNESLNIGKLNGALKFSRKFTKIADVCSIKPSARTFIPEKVIEMGLL
jgi:hypothetical protein